MTRYANLTSVDAVRLLAAALRSFEEDAGGALADLQMQVNRVLEWIHHDRKEYWAERVRRGHQEVAEAKQNLERRLIYRATDERPSCREEKAALEKAKRRLEVAQEKVQAVRQWAHSIEHEIRDFRGSINQLAGWVQTDLPRACAVAADEPGPGRLCQLAVARGRGGRRLDGVDRRSLGVRGCGHGGKRGRGDGETWRRGGRRVSPGGHAGRRGEEGGVA